MLAGRSALLFSTRPSCRIADLSPVLSAAHLPCNAVRCPAVRVLEVGIYNVSHLSTNMRTRETERRREKEARKEWTEF